MVARLASKRNQRRRAKARFSWAWKAGQAHEKRTSTPTLDPTSASNPRALCVLSFRNFGVQRNGGQTESPSHDSDEHALTPRVRDENDIVREMEFTLKSWTISGQEDKVEAWKEAMVRSDAIGRGGNIGIIWWPRTSNPYTKHCCPMLFRM